MKHLFTFIFILLTISLFAQDQESNKEWFHTSPTKDGQLGTSADLGNAKLKSNAATVIVAIIDSGVDAEHEDLKDVMWVNPGEIAGNGIDDDKNGYKDDVHGWNFIGNENGDNVSHDTYEVTRLYGSMKYKYDAANPNLLNKKQKAEYEKYLVYKDQVEKSIKRAKANLERIGTTENYINDVLASIKSGLGDKELSLENLDSLEAKGNTEVPMMKNILNQVIASGEPVPTMNEMIEGSKEQFASQKERYKNQLEYAFNPDFNTREIVKDNYADPSEKYYGNSDVQGPDALHGTHVAGIVAANRVNNLGAKGIADNVKIMSVRVVPDGDERDKDVANGIRYAVDNGASIINMSFGKGQSWNKKIVDDAVRYAEKKDVLLVHAAGNSAQDNDVTDNFPNDRYDKKRGRWLRKKRHAQNWLSVGANNSAMDENSVAGFSNYGQKNVDIFAPGTVIYAPIPDNNYMFLQGTSMAAPVVAGVAAVVRSQYPRLTAKQVKEILMESSYKHNVDVIQPKTGETVPFSTLSVSGGVVDLEAALKLASRTKGKKKIKKNKNKA